jgi:hypothetical protein
VSAKFHKAGINGASCIGRAPARTNLAGGKIFPPARHNPPQGRGPLLRERRWRQSAAFEAAPGEVNEHGTA